MSLLEAWKNVDRPVIGMLHAPPLPGSPGYCGNIEQIREFVLTDAANLAAGGVDGLLLENFGDTPFYPAGVPPITIVHMTALAVIVRRKVNLPLGINVLRNDGMSAISIAHAVGASFVRVNVLCGTRVTDQGTIEGQAHDILRLRAQLNGKLCEPIKILADVSVKHSAPLFPRPLKDEVGELIQRCRADGVIVSGTATGAMIDPEELAEVSAAAGQVPVFVGSGVTAKNLPKLREHANGYIVGSSLKKDGDISNPVDKHRVREIMAAARPVSSSAK